MSKITYTDKVALNINQDVADINKCNATDLNEIKNVVNENDDDFNTLNTNVGNITQLQTTDKSSVVNAINEVNQNDKNKGTYSTQETRIGTWINGKPLYRKVIEYIGDMTNLTTISHGISNADLVFVENSFQYVNQGDERLCYPYPITLYADNKTQDKVSVRVNRTAVTFMADTTWGSRWTVIIILNYTKTTD